MAEDHQAPEMYELTAITGRTRNVGRPMIVSNFGEVSFHNGMIALVSLFVGVLAFLLFSFILPGIGLFVLLPVPIVVILALTFYNVRTKRLRVSLYEGIRDRRRSGSKMGKVMQCGVLLSANPHRIFQTRYTAADVSASPLDQPGLPRRRADMVPSSVLTPPAAAVSTVDTEALDDMLAHDPFAGPGRIDGPAIEDAPVEDAPFEGTHSSGPVRDPFDPFEDNQWTEMTNAAQALRFGADIRRHFLRAFGVLAALLTSLILVAGPALANNGNMVIDDSGGGGSAGYCSTSYAEENVAVDRLLPVNRWISATSTFHSRTAGGLSTDIFGEVQRNITAGTTIAAGNAAWSATSSLVSMASRFCFAEDLSVKIDSVAGQLAKALFSPTQGAPLVGGIFILAVFAIVWGSIKRGQGLWAAFKRLIPKILVLVLFALAMIGASNTDPDKGTFGLGSPGWMITTVNDTISSAAAAPAAAVVLPGDVDPADTDNATDAMSCYVYHNELKTQFWERYSHLGTPASMPLLLSNIWETTGLEAWKIAQFGQNRIADLNYCRVADWFAGIPTGTLNPSDTNWLQVEWRSSTLGVMSNYWPDDWPEPVPGSLAWAPAGAITEDVSAIAWAVCIPDGASSWKFRSDSSTVGNVSELLNTDDAEPDGDGMDPEETGGTRCDGWWVQSAVEGSGGFDDGGSIFDWAPDQGNIQDKTTGQAEDFLLTFHSNKAGTAGQAGVAYLISAIFMFVVFGLMSLTVVLAKFMLVAMVLGVFATLAYCLMPNTEVGVQLAAMFKRVIGISLIASGSTLLFALVGLLTSLLVGMSTTMAEPGTIGAMAWSALSPIAAIAVLVYLFKKVMRAPNPFSLRGGLAWGGAGGMLGTAAASSIMDRGGSAVASQARQMGSNAGKALLARAGINTGKGGALGKAGKAGMAAGAGRAVAGGTSKGAALAAGVGAGAAGAVAGNALADKFGSGAGGADDKATGSVLGWRDRIRAHADSGKQAQAERAERQQQVLAARGLTDAPRAEQRRGLAEERALERRVARKKARDQWNEDNKDALRFRMQRELDKPINSRLGDSKIGRGATQAARAIKVTGSHVGSKIAQRSGIPEIRAAWQKDRAAGVGLAARKVLTGGAKVAGVGLAAAALGPALPFAAAGVAAYKIGKGASKTKTAAAVRARFDQSRAASTRETIDGTRANHARAQEQKQNDVPVTEVGNAHEREQASIDQARAAQQDQMGPPAEEDY